MGFTTARKDAILSSELITNRYLALSTTTPNARTGANFTEPNDAKYYRVPLTSGDFGNLIIVDGAGSNARMIKNKRAIEFQPMLAAHTVTHYGIFTQEAKGQGTPIFTAPLTDGAGLATSVQIPAEAVFLFDYDVTTGEGSYRIEFADEDTPGT